MNNVLVSAGAASIILAVVGGGARAFGVEVPVLDSVARQVALGLVGVVFLVAAFVVGDGGNDGKDGKVQAYRQEVLAACRSIRQGSGLPPLNNDGSVDRDAYVSWLGGKLDASQSILGSLWKRPVPDRLKDHAADAEQNANDLLKRSRAAVSRLQLELPSRFALLPPPAAIQGVENELREPNARFEGSMSLLAGQACTPTAPVAGG
jgi:hypothetical protein